MQQQVAEIGGVERLQPLLIEAIELDRPAVGEIAAGSAAGTLSGVRPRSFQRSIAPRSARGGPALVVDILGRGDLLDQAQLVVGVEDGEIGLQPDRLGMAAQDARGDRMEGAEPQALGGLADHRAEPLAHLAAPPCW